MSANDFALPSRRRFLIGTVGALATTVAAGPAMAAECGTTPTEGALREDNPDYRVVKANGVHLVTQSFGDPANPALVFLSGGNSSLLRMKQSLCETMVESGFFVIRYDLRDTGRSVTYAPYDPPYTIEDLADDAIGILDAYGIQRAHFVGQSLGGMIGQHIGLRHPDRALTLTLWSSTPDPNAIAIATTAGVSAEGALPPPGERIFELIEILAACDWNSEQQAVETLVKESAFISVAAPIDVAEETEIARLEVRRAVNIFSHRFNHAIMEGRTAYWRDRLGSIVTPTLVIHGKRDDVLPPPHGEALANEIPGARLLMLETAGHSFPTNEELDEKLIPTLVDFMKSA